MPLYQILTLTMKNIKNSQWPKIEYELPKIEFELPNIIFEIPKPNIEFQICKIRKIKL